MSSTDKYIFLLRMKPFLSLFLWNLTSIFHSVETLHKILCRNFSSKRQIALFFQFLVQISDDFISPTDAFSSPSFVFQKFLRRFFNRNFIILINSTIHQAEIFIVKGIIISFFCSLNSKIPFYYLICQFTKNLFFQIQERIQLFKTNTIYKMSSYFSSVIQNYDITDRQGMPTEVFPSSCGISQVSSTP